MAAVLVAIAIPVFTARLEQSRETTDIANLRSAYAAGQVAALTGYVGESAIGESESLKYYPNKNGSLDVDGVAIGQGTSTDGKADTSAISGGIIQYNTKESVKSQKIHVDISGGVVSGVYFGS